MTDDDFLALVRKRFEAAMEEEKDLRLKFISDLRFASPDGDEQWDPQLKAQREAAGRPAMSFPRCHTFVQQVANEARQNKPQIKFAPRLDGDDDTAEVYEGLARFIQYASDAQVAYETSVEYSAGGSFGYYRMLTDYVDEDSDDLELMIKPIHDPLTVYGVLVPACFGRKPKFGFVIEEIPKEEYKALYPDSEFSSISWGDAEKRGEGWFGTETVRIAEYWWVEEEKEKGKRRSKRIVKTCKVNGYEILPDTKTDWAGSNIPIYPVLGKQMIMEGKPHLFSVVRPQKAAQLLINYSKSRIAETLSTSPISPFMVVEGQIAGYEKQWQAMNTTVTPFLQYRAVDVAGRTAPAPQRQTFEPPIQALSAFVAQEVDDLKATAGIYDASMGAAGNEVTGKAIMARNSQSNLTTMHFLDNLERSFRQAGEDMVELIPKIYDTEREIQILGEDEAPKVVLINKKHIDDGGKERNYDFTAGKYSVVVTMGRAFNTKRMETFDMLQQLVQSAPNLLPTFGDVMFRNSDMAGSEIVAERFHKMLPPQLQNNADEQMPPQAQAAVAQAQQRMQQMQVELQQLQQEKAGKQWEIQGKAQLIQMQSQADQQLERLKLETDVVKSEVNTKAQNSQERTEFVDDIVKKLIDHKGKLELLGHSQSHDHAMKKVEHSHSDQAMQHAADLAQQNEPDESQPAQV